MEVRLCAERPREDYRPTPGAVTHVWWPEGPGLRTDRAVESGSTVSPAYDSLVAKLMAHGGDRAAAVAKLSLALRSLELDGLETNRDLLAAVLDDDAFRRRRSWTSITWSAARTCVTSRSPTRCAVATVPRRPSA